MSKRTLTTPEELRDFAIGKQIYKAGGYLNDCTSEAMRQGFSRMASHSIFMDWQLFEEQPKQAVKFSESALSDFAGRNIYEFGIVEESPIF